MSHLLSRFKACANCLMLCTLTGCWYVPVRVDPQLAAPAASLDPSRLSPDSRPVVVVRYPSLVADDAMDAFHRQLMLAHADAEAPSKKVAPHAPAMANEILTKTAYYVLELHQTLQRALPPRTVLLQPEQVVVDSTGKLALRPSIAPPPHAVVIDFWIDVASVRFIESRPWFNDTFGRELTARLTIHSADPTLPVSRRLLASTGAPTQAKDGSPGFTFANMLDGVEYHYRPKASGFDGVPVIKRRPAAAGKYFAFTNRGYACEPEAVYLDAAGPDGTAASPFGAVWELYSNLLVDYLNTLDLASAARPTTSAYASTIDPALANEIRGGRCGPGDGRYDLVASFAAAERDFVAAQDQAMYRAIYRGPFGDAVRQSRAAEQRVVDAQQASRDRRTQSALLAGLSSFAYSTSAANGAISSQQNALAQATVLGGAVAGGIREQRAVQAVFASMRNHFERIQDAATEVMIRTSKGERRIRASGLAELREQFRQVYAEEFSASPASAR